jgi:hypothetical protein
MISEGFMAYGNTRHEHSTPALGPSTNRADSHSEESTDAIDYQRLRKMAIIARAMDTAVGIPFTRWRLGADSVLGLVPGLGDVASAVIALYLVNEARKLGIPREKLARMAVNVGVDTVGGVVPLLGDVFDVFFKANRKNLGIVLDHLGLTPDDLKRTGRR